MKLKEVIRRLDRRCTLEVEKDGRVMLYVNGEYECSGNESFVINYIEKNGLLLRETE